jgi:DNA-binding MarR family transcriptional regulator
LENVTEIPFGLSFAQITKLYYGALSHMLEDLPLERHYTTLLMIGSAPGKCTQQYLSGALHIDKVSMVRIMDYLTGKGLIRRIVNPEDRREQLLALTPKGRKIMPAINKAVMEINSKALEGISEKDKAKFMSNMRMMRENLAGLPANNVNIRIKKPVKA